jgi:hypothetical protein
LVDLKKPGLPFEIKDNYLSGDLQFDSGNLYYGKGVIIFNIKALVERNGGVAFKEGLSWIKNFTAKIWV